MFVELRCVLMHRFGVFDMRIVFLNYAGKKNLGNDADRAAFGGAGGTDPLPARNKRHVRVFFLNLHFVIYAFISHTQPKK
jgi:hypothetical protein